MVQSLWWVGSESGCVTSTWVYRVELVLASGFAGEVLHGLLSTTDGCTWPASNYCTELSGIPPYTSLTPSLYPITRPALLLNLPSHVLSHPVSSVYGFSATVLYDILLPCIFSSSALSTPHNLIPELGYLLSLYCLLSLCCFTFHVLAWHSLVPEARRLTTLRLPQ